MAEDEGCAWLELELAEKDEVAEDVA